MGIQTSAGLIVYRKNNDKIEFFVGHPGGPYWKNQKQYYFLKGHVEEGETILEAALREFEEESGRQITSEPLKYLGLVKQSKKNVHAFLIKDNFDERKCYSNTCEVEFPPKSGQLIEINEIDDYKWLTFEELKDITHPKHLPLYEESLNYINDTVD